MTNILIAYFSPTGHTKEFAQEIARQTAGDLFEIRTNHFYPLEHDSCSLQAHQEQLEDFRPQLPSQVPNMEMYDVVFIGHPIWWYREPMVIRTFYESYDFSGKRVVPFATSGDVDLENTIKDMKTYLSNAIIEEGLRLNSYAVATSQTKISQWLKKLKEGVQHDKS